MSFFPMMKESTLAKWIPEDYDMLIFFPRQDKKLSFSFSDMLDCCRDLGMHPYWQTMRIVQACPEGKYSRLRLNSHHYRPMKHCNDCKTEETVEFDKKYLHNYGPLNPVPIGAMALCGAISKSGGPGVEDPNRNECCPICLALTEYE